jgi:hypothetical protein
MRRSSVDRVRTRLSVAGPVHRVATEVAALAGLSASQILEDLLGRQYELLERRLRELEIEQARCASSPEEVVSIFRRVGQRMRPVRDDYQDHSREEGSYLWSADAHSEDEIEHLVALEAIEKSMKSTYQAFGNDRNRQKRCSGF